MEEFKKLTDDLNGKFEKLQKSIDQKADEAKIVSDIADIREKMENIKDVEYFQNMQKQLDGMEKNIQEVLTRGEKENVDSVTEALKSEEYKKFVKGDVREFTMFQKASDITTSNSFTETNGPIIPRTIDPRIGAAPNRGIVLQTLFNRGITNSDVIQSTYKSSETDASAARAEAATMAQGDLAWTTEKFEVEHISEYMKVARQKLEDINFILNQINNRLVYRHLQKLEKYCFDGTGSSNQIDGIIGATKYKAFNAPSAFEELIPNANYQDVIKVALAQLEEGDTSDALAYGYFANGIIVSISDYYFMAMLKDQECRPLMGNDGVLRIMGVPVYKSKYMTAGTFLVGDFKASTLWTRENAVIKMWDQNSTDPIYDLVTFTINGRYALETQTPDTFGYVYGTFAAGIEEINLVTA